MLATSSTGPSEISVTTRIVIAVDASVWIDFFRGASTPAVERFVRLIDDAGIAITGVILTEYAPESDALV